MRVPTGRLRIVSPTGGDDGPSSPWPASPGRYIQEQRIRLGLTLEELATRTKIPRTSLEALEGDRHEELPGPVFVKGFLRCCARSLHLEVDVVLELLLEQERVERERVAKAEAAAVAEAERSGARVTPIEQALRLERSDDDIEIEDEVELEPENHEGRVAGAKRTLGLDARAGSWLLRVSAWLGELMRARLGAALQQLPNPRALMWFAFAMLLVVAVCSASVIAATGGIQHVAMPHS
ncbi:MAG: helix-turn-helix domain-containing protein [Myxococcales bacterium]|nr:helix-turn-helix domain-containing protein [Myxococcales bacterium]MCB9754390.1 helix-turn-helix domain-containing protein [Myxococcales bacterium]